MRLLSLLPVTGHDGAGLVAATLAADACRRGHRVTFAGPGGPGVAEVTAAGGDHVALSCPGSDPADLGRPVWELRAHCGTHPPDLVHAHGLRAALVGRLAAGAEVPVLTTLHGLPARDLPAGAEALRRTSDRVVVGSPRLAEQLAAHGCPPGRLRLIEGAVVPPATHGRAEARARLGLTADGTVGLCLAPPADRSTRRMLLDAWARLPRGATLLVAHDAAGPSGLEVVVTGGGARPHPVPTDDRPDRSWLLAAADLLVHPGCFDVLPTSVLDAMSVGVPVVAHRVRGVAGSLGHAVRFVEPGSANALAAGLLELVTDAGARARTARAGRELVAARFGVGRMLDRYAAAYDDVLLAGRERWLSGGASVGGWA